MDDTRLVPCLTPRGRLILGASDDAVALDPAIARRMKEAFASGSGHALLRLGASELGTVLPPAFAYWREFGTRYMTARCSSPAAGEVHAGIFPPPDSELLAMALATPTMPGAEYLTAALLGSLWMELDQAFAAACLASNLSVQDFLKKLNPVWNIVGRVHFNLAVNRKDTEAPFAFLATFTDRVSGHGKAQHRPLDRAARVYTGVDNKEKLLSLLLPVQRASFSLFWLREMVDSGELFRPLRWTPQDALRLLQGIPVLEAAGVVVRLPADWKFNRPSRPQVTATIGGKAPVGLGTDSLLDFDVSVTLDGQCLTAAEINELLAGTDGLALFRGRWVEVDRGRLGHTLERFKEAQKLVTAQGLSFVESMRLLAGAGIVHERMADRADVEWSSVIAGDWLKSALAGLRSPEGLARIDSGAELRGTLRPYQEVGVRWLNLLSHLGLGACLADDMGLGKTIQVLALLLERRRVHRGRNPSLLVAPATLLANWADEIKKFAPSLKVLVLHPSAAPISDLKAFDLSKLAALDLVMTSYGTLPNIPWLTTTPWRVVVIDEAQAIKNPGTRQTRMVKRLIAESRIAVTGTPLENRLGDLWSIFDFINPGLLGTAKEFSGYIKKMNGRLHNPYGPLRDLVRPYILRRLKTDRSIAQDLPAKNEVKAYCPLSRVQAALYRKAVEELAVRLRTAAGIERKGLVFAYLVRLKQICNHPSHWTGDGAWAPADSGKWERLREIAEVIAAKQEKVLVFTQFREMADPLSAYLQGIFGRPGLVLHGGTAVKRRRELVKRFQEDESVPFFVLSLKAGGTGLNLTAASHVVHFDRWWNPAVEEQATDRAFRIGQTKNVLVHKFICRGTVEEKIDALIESKKCLSKDLLEGGTEINLTEMGDDELLKLVALNLDTALAE